MDDNETRNRRVRLRELINVCFDKLDVRLIKFVEERGEGKINQGELSALQKDDGKSFGDKKARTLTQQIGLNRRWFDMPPGTNLDRSSWMLDEPRDGQAKSVLPALNDVVEIHRLYLHANVAHQTIVDVVLGGLDKAPDWMPESTKTRIDALIKEVQEHSPDTQKKSAAS